ncbi:hypothetical protein RCL1_000038 [Eukaryota sp. TZLM3-RCL]
MEPPLNLLLQAPSKAALHESVSIVFMCLGDSSSSPDSQIASLLNVSNDDAKSIRESLTLVINKAIDADCSTRDQVIPLFSTDVHDQLKSVLSKLILKHLPDYKHQATTLPSFASRLSSINTRVELKQSTQNTSVPRAVVELKLLDSMGSTEETVFELNRQSLSIIIDGLSKIKEQLISMSST